MNTAPRQMELYASGFNAWDQLSFQNLGSHDEPEDLHQFTRVLAGNVIEHPRASLSHTTVTIDGSTVTAGFSPRGHQELQASDPSSYVTLAEASNEVIAILGSDGSLQQYRSLTDLLSRHQQAQTFTGLPKCRQVVAYETGFAALTPNGDVYSWGDERYAACLGREVSEDIPAGQPTLVTALQDLPTGPIVKIAAGGYILAALTSGNDLYLWGGHPGRKAILPDVADEPTPIDIDGRDIADVAVGESHLVVLMTDGHIFVIGDNTNGQLGLPAKSVESWTPVELDLKDDRRAVGVVAGPKNTFIIIQKKAT